MGGVQGVICPMLCVMSEFLEVVAQWATRMVILDTADGAKDEAYRICIPGGHVRRRHKFLVFLDGGGSNSGALRPGLIIQRRGALSFWVESTDEGKSYYQ